LRCEQAAAAAVAAEEMLGVVHVYFQETEPRTNRYTGRFRGPRKEATEDGGQEVANAGSKKKKNLLTFHNTKMSNKTHNTLLPTPNREWFIVFFVHNVTETQPVYSALRGPRKEATEDGRLIKSIYGNAGSGTSSFCSQCNRKATDIQRA
jgi:hypothetical protein